MEPTVAAHDVIERYFVLATAPDPEPYLAQFTDDAVAEDEGHVHEGADAIRAWRAGVPSVASDVRGVEATDDGHRALVVVSGDFPGSPVTLAFLFVLDGGRIRRLTVRPA